MGWQEFTALAIVFVTALAFAWNFFRPRPLPFQRHGSCGCSGASSIGPRQSIVLHGRKGERPKVLVKAG